MNIQQKTIGRVHNIVKGLRVGDVVTTKTLDGTHPYTSFFVRRGHLVRIIRGKYRVLRDMPEEAVKGVIELYNLSQNKGRELSKTTRPAPDSRQAKEAHRIRRSHDYILDLVYDNVKGLKNGDRVLLNKLGASRSSRIRLLKSKTILRAGFSRSAGCIWNGGSVSKDELNAIMFGRRHKRRSPISKQRWPEPPPKAFVGLETRNRTAVKKVDADAPLTIESNGFRITLDKGSITISK